MKDFSDDGSYDESDDEYSDDQNYYYRYSDEDNVSDLQFLTSFEVKDL